MGVFGRLTLARLGLGLFNHAAGLGIPLLDVLLQHLFLDAPLPASSDLNGFQLTAADQGVGLRRIYLQLFGDVRQSQESGHVTILASVGTV